MRKLPTFLLALVPIVASATLQPSLILPDLKLPMVATRVGQPSLFMPDLKIEIPPFLVAEAALPNLFPGLTDAKEWSYCKSLSVATKHITISNMPVLLPRADIDSKIVHIPNGSVDYKLIVEVPDVESAK